MKLNTAWLNVWTRLFNYPDETLKKEESESTSHHILKTQSAIQYHPEVEVFTTDKEKCQHKNAKTRITEHASEALVRETDASCSKPFILSLDGDLV